MSEGSAIIDRMMNARVLADRLSELLSREHAAMADFLVDLAEFDRRRGWEELGYASLFYFLHRELGLSTGAAHYRKVAAELMQKFPEIVQPLRDGAPLHHKHCAARQGAHADCRIRRSSP